MPAWKAESWVKSPAGVRFSRPLPKYMKYNCRYCKKEWDTVQSNLRCTCGADLNESIRIANKLWLEKQMDLKKENA